MYFDSQFNKFISLSNTKMKISFGKRFEDMFTEVLESVRKRSNQKPQNDSPFSQSLKKTHFLMNSVPLSHYQSSFSQKRSYLVAARSKERRILSETFTTFKNVRYRLGENPETSHDFHIKNLTFSNPQSPERKKIYLSPIVSREQQVSQQNSVNNHSLLMSKRDKNDQLYPFDISMGQSVRFQRRKQSKHIKKFKKTEGIQGWVSKYQEEDISEFINKSKRN